MIRKLLRISKSKGPGDAIDTLKGKLNLVERDVESKEIDLLSWLVKLDFFTGVMKQEMRDFEMNGSVDPDLAKKHLQLAKSADIQRHGCLVEDNEAAASYAVELHQDYTPEQLASITPETQTSPLLRKILSMGEQEDVLYHGSAYLQDELKPGYQHSKKQVVWDKYESNHWLYATTNRLSAELLGISSCWEKLYDLKETHFDQKTKKIHLVFYKSPPSVELLKEAVVYLYTLPYNPTVWVKNNNPNNNIEDEYKTQATITTILDREQLDVAEVLKNWRIEIEVAK